MSDDNTDAGDAPDKPAVKIMNVQTRFTSMASRKGGMARSDALNRADTFIGKIEEKYPAWIDRDMRELVRHIEQVHADDGFTAATYEAVYRKAGHIRDMGGTFGYHMTTSVGDSMCELIFRLGEGKHYSRQALDAHMDALRLVCTPAFKDVAVSDVQPLMDSLEKLVRKYPDPEAGLKVKAERERAKLQAVTKMS
ncbi:MAG: hypothetical protein O2985_16705 [Proteobacteria bacterium]|nr:hypothetical protein [Pseudomonadota bacterium]